MDFFVDFTYARFLVRPYDHRKDCHDDECVCGMQNVLNKKGNKTPTRHDIEHRFRVCLAAAAAAGRQIRHKTGLLERNYEHNSYHPARLRCFPFSDERCFSSRPVFFSSASPALLLLPAVTSSSFGLRSEEALARGRPARPGTLSAGGGAHCFTQHPVAPGANQLFLTASVESCANGS